jgi:hypothetical protein
MKTPAQTEVAPGSSDSFNALGAGLKPPQLANEIQYLPFHAGAFLVGAPNSAVVAFSGL